MADDAQIKLTLETADARKKLDRLRDDMRRAGDTAGDAMQSASGGLSKAAGQIRGLAGRSLAGGLGALGQAGSGGTDFAIQALEIFKRELPTVLGRIAGPAGLAAGVGAAAGIERQFGPQVRAREAAIGQAAALTQRFADVGRPVSSDDMKALVSQLHTINARSEANVARARSAAGGGDLLKKMLAAAAGAGQ